VNQYFVSLSAYVTSAKVHRFREKVKADVNFRALRLLDKFNVKRQNVSSKLSPLA
jgi:hypothetical protein